MTRTQTTIWDPVDGLKTVEDIAAHLKVAFEDGDPELITELLGDIARSKGMTQIAKITGLSRQSLYKALSPEGNPEFATIMKVLQAVGLNLTISETPTRDLELDDQAMGSAVRQNV